MVDITKDEIWDKKYEYKKSTGSTLWKKMLKRNKLLVIGLIMFTCLISVEFILIYKFFNLLASI